MISEMHSNDFLLRRRIQSAAAIINLILIWEPERLTN